MWIKRLMPQHLVTGIMLRILLYGAVSVVLYICLSRAAASYMDRVVTWDSYQNEVASMVTSLRNYIEENQLSVLDRDQLAKWDEDNGKIQIRIIAKNRVVYETTLDRDQTGWTYGDPYQMVRDLRYRSVVFTDSPAIVYLNTQSYLQMKRNLTLGAIGISVLVFMLLVFWMLLRLVRDILRINEGVEVFETGGLDYQIQVKWSGELHALADNLNRMSGELARRIRADEATREDMNGRITRLSHDLRTPLTMILGYSERLQRTDLTEEQRTEALHYLTEQAEMLRTVVEQGFSSHSLTTSPTSFALQPVEGGSYLRWQVGSMASSLRLNGFTCTWSSRPEIPFGLEIDPVQMFRLFTNITGNVVRYGDKTAPVELSLDIGQTQVTFRIRNRILQPRPAGSSGMGLRNCTTILAGHGGQFFADEENGWYTSAFTLPRLDLPDPKPGPEM